MKRTLTSILICTPLISGCAEMGAVGAAGRTSTDPRTRLLGAFFQSYGETQGYGEQNKNIVNAITGAGRDIREGLSKDNDPYKRTIWEEEKYKTANESREVNLSTLVGKTVSLQADGSISWPASKDGTYMGLVEGVSTDDKTDRNNYPYTWSPARLSPEFFFIMNPVNKDEIFTFSWNDKNKDGTIENSEINKTDTFDKNEKFGFYVRIGAIAKGKKWGAAIARLGKKIETNEDCIIEEPVMNARVLDLSDVEGIVSGEKYDVILSINNSEHVRKTISIR
jgi:hypothetical protein